MRRLRLAIAIFATVWLTSAAVADPQGAGTVPAPAATAWPFFAYLQRQHPAAALVAFSPTHHDPRPGQRTVPSAASLRSDLEALRPAFDGLILYRYEQDVTPTLVAEATRQGYRGILLGIEDPRSDEELTGTAALVQRYAPALALAVCIGNEGILFNKYTLHDLSVAADRFKALLGSGAQVPLCTSEPLGPYAAAHTLREFGDFLAPNIHPVFDRPDLDPEAAAAWVRERALALAEIARKPVLVKETGMPHGGKPQFTPATQHAFWAAYVKPGRLEHVAQYPEGWVSYAAAFEAFDLPWKAAETQLPIEQEWGLLSNDRQAFPAFLVWKKLQDKRW